MRARDRKDMRIRVDGYTRVCLTVIAVLLVVLIVGLWAERISPARDARAAEILWDAGAQRKAVLKAQRETNDKLDELIGLFRDGNAKVRLVDGEAGDGGRKDAGPPAKPE